MSATAIASNRFAAVAGQRRVLLEDFALLRTALQGEVRKSMASRLDGVDQVLAHTPVIGVIGMFKAGKSTLVNDLLGHEFAKTDDLPANAVPTLFRFGLQQKVICHRRSGDPYEIRIESLHSFSAEGDSTKSAARAELERIEVFLPLPLLRSVEILDTPGLNAPSHAYGGHAQSTTDVLGMCDGLLFVTPLSQAGSKAEVEFLAEQRASRPDVPICAVLTHLDLHDSDERPLESTIASISRRFGQHAPTLIPYLPKQIREEGCSSLEATYAIPDISIAVLNTIGLAAISEVHRAGLSRLVIELYELNAHLETAIGHLEHRTLEAELLRLESWSASKAIEIIDLDGFLADSLVDSSVLSKCLASSLAISPSGLGTELKAARREGEQLRGLALRLQTTREDLERRSSHIEELRAAFHRKADHFINDVEEYKKSGLFGRFPIAGSLFDGGRKRRLAREHRELVELEATIQEGLSSLVSSSQGYAEALSGLKRDIPSARKRALKARTEAIKTALASSSSKPVIAGPDGCLATASGIRRLITSGRVKLLCDVSADMLIGRLGDPEYAFLEKLGSTTPVKSGKPPIRLPVEVKPVWALTRGVPSGLNPGPVSFFDRFGFHAFGAGFKFVLGMLLGGLLGSFAGAGWSVLFGMVLGASAFRAFGGRGEVRWWSGLWSLMASMAVLFVAVGSFTSIPVAEIVGLRVHGLSHSIANMVLAALLGLPIGASLTVSRTVTGRALWTAPVSASLATAIIYILGARLGVAGAVALFSFTVAVLIVVGDKLPFFFVKRAFVVWSCVLGALLCYSILLKPGSSDSATHASVAGSQVTSVPATPQAVPTSSSVGASGCPVAGEAVSIVSALNGSLISNAGQGGEQGLEVHLDQPVCGQSDAKLIFSSGDDLSAAMLLKGCAVSINGKLRYIDSSTLAVEDPAITAPAGCPVQATAAATVDETPAPVAAPPATPPSFPVPPTSTGQVARAVNPEPPPPPAVPVSGGDTPRAKRLNAEGLRLLSLPAPDIDGARRAFSAAVQADPNNVEAENNLGYVYSRSGDYALSEAILMKVVSMDSGRRVAQGNLAYVQAKLGRTKDSAEHYCQYMKLFSSIEQGKATLMKLGNDPDPRVRLAIGAAFAHCAK